MIPLAIERPKPLPSCFVSFACQKRSKTFGNCSVGIPGPVSDTEIRIPALSGVAISRTVPPTGVNLIAFPKRFESTWLTRSASQSIKGRAGSKSTSRCCRQMDSFLHRKILRAFQPLFANAGKLESIKFHVLCNPKHK